MLHGAALEAGDLHLRDAEKGGAALLRETAVIAQADDSALARREGRDGGAQGDLLEHALGRVIIAEHLLEGEAVLPRLLLERLGRRGGGLRHGDLLRLEPGFRSELGDGRLAVQALFERAARLLDARGLLPERAADLDGAVVAQEAADLPRDLRHGIGGKLRAVILVEIAHGLEKAEAAELKQIVRLDAPAEIAPRDRPDEAGVLAHHGVHGVRVPVPRGAQARKALGVHQPRPVMRRRIVTVVPRPGAERTRSLSVKPSMIVKPMPLRSSPPVV